MSQIPGLPDKWKLIHCSATNSDIPDHPRGKWRDADILNLLREIAELSNDNKLIRLNHPFGTMYDAIKKAQADNKALLGALNGAVQDLTMSMLVMDAESRKCAMQCIKSYKAVIAEHSEPQ